MTQIDSLYQDAAEYFERGEYVEAQNRYEKILHIEPVHAGALHDLGVILFSQGDATAGAGLLKRTVEACPENTVYLNNYAVLLLALNRSEEAIKLLDRAINLAPDYADAYSNLGLALSRLDRPVEAEAALLRALQLVPKHDDAQKHLAELYQRIGLHHGTDNRFEQAEIAFEAALRFRPNDPILHLAQGTMAAHSDRFDVARSAFEKAAVIVPEKQIWRYKYLGFCPTVFDNEDEIEEYRHHLHAELDRVLDSRIPMDWRTLWQDAFIPSFNLAHLDHCCRDIREKFARLFLNAFSEGPPEPPQRSRRRVGFVVGPEHGQGFRRMVYPIAKLLDRERFEPIVFAAPDSVALFPNAQILPDNFEQAVAVLRRAQCDVLHFWKAGSTPFAYFLPFARCAPVQCTSYGTHGTSGIPAVNDFLSSFRAEPEDADSHYSERLIRTESHPLYYAKLEKPAPVDRLAFPVPKKGTLYFCPHRIAKYHPKFDDYLKDILDADTEANILMLDGKRETPRVRLRKRMSRTLGPERMRRVIFFHSLDEETYYRLLSICDIVLDSPVYAGDQTAFDALAFGIPIITQRGHLAMQRTTAALFDSIGITDTVTTDREGYVAAALRLSFDPEFRQDCSRRILRFAAPLFDNVQTVTDFENYLAGIET